jgi:hypothetical protein
MIERLYYYKNTPDIPAAWYSMFYTYTAATVLLAARLQPALEGELGSEMSEAWKMALIVLRKFEAQYGNRSATRCLQALEVIHDKIFRVGDQEREPVFEYLPDLGEPAIDFMDHHDTSVLFTMINDQTGPFEGSMFQYSFRDVDFLRL